ncbi:MAG TPA: hypothetical protein PK843_00245 [bacterium]|nr:hypothetical protein [bacterium]
MIIQIQAQLCHRLRHNYSPRNKCRCLRHYPRKHQRQSNPLAEYSFAGIDKPIGISTYELTRALPKDLRSALPTVEEIEAELAEVVMQRPGRKSKERKQ